MANQSVAADVQKLTLGGKAKKPKIYIHVSNKGLFRKGRLLGLHDHSAGVYCRMGKTLKI